MQTRTARATARVALIPDRCEGLPLSNLIWLPPFWLLDDQQTWFVCALSAVMDTQLGDEERGPFVRFQSSSELSGGGDEPASFRFPLSERSQDGTEGDTELSINASA